MHPSTCTLRRTSGVISNSAVTPDGAMPTRTHRPPSAVISVAWRTVRGCPTASMTISAPPPVSSRTASTGSPLVASTVAVAPSPTAAAKRSRVTSTR